MKVVGAKSKFIDLGESLINEDGKGLSGVNELNGVIVLDSGMKILPLISDFLSYMVQSAKLSYKSATTYGRNLSYFLKYLKSRVEFKDTTADEAYITVQRHVIKEYMAQLRNIEKKSSKTIRNRDSAIRAFVEGYLCKEFESRPALREMNPYVYGYLSNSPKSKLVESCDLDDLYELINSTDCERERVLLQFMYDSGVRRSEVPRISLYHINEALNFNKQRFLSNQGLNEVSAPYSPLLINGSKGRADEIKERHALVSKATLGRIKKYHASPLYKKHIRKYSSQKETPAFLNAEGCEYTDKSISKLFDRLSKRAIKAGRLTRKISSHKLRHGNAYALLQSDDLGSDYLDRLVILQKSLGHANINTSEIYTRLPKEIYKTMTDENGEVVSRNRKMEILVEKTQLKIKIGDKK
jgi:integrase/recombinase XerD